MQHRMPPPPAKISLVIAIAIIATVLALMWVAVSSTRKIEIEYRKDRARLECDNGFVSNEFWKIRAQEKITYFYTLDERQPSAFYKTPEGVMCTIIRHKRENE